jgi:GNAT superfamily N-acetyltransferase
VGVDAIVALRDEYRREMACQIVHDSWHPRGFTQSYLLQWDGEIVGYGSVGGVPPEARNIVKEFFVGPASRGMALLLFRALVDASGAAVVEAQTNDQRTGLGSYLLQELKRICHEDGRIPAARCHQDNAASRRTLQRAGMFPCAHRTRERRRARIALRLSKTSPP